MSDPINFMNEDNYFRNAVLNTIEILKKYARAYKRDIRNYYEDDVTNPVTPCFMVLMGGSSDELRASQALNRVKYTIHMEVEIWYLHADLTEETKRNEVTYILWEVSDYLKKNITLNGFVPKLGIRITSTKWIPQKIGNRILAGGMIGMQVPKLYSTNVTQ